MTTYVTHYVVEKRDDSHAVDAVTKSYGSIGPDPGTEVDRENCVEGVSREYAEMLARELTKRDFESAHARDLNIFAIAPAVARVVDMWTGPNAAEWADNPRHRLVY